MAWGNVKRTLLGVVFLRERFNVLLMLGVFLRIEDGVDFVGAENSDILETWKVNVKVVTQKGAKLRTRLKLVPCSNQNVVTGSYGVILVLFVVLGELNMFRLVG